MKTTFSTAACALILAVSGCSDNASTPQDGGSADSRVNPVIVAIAAGEQHSLLLTEGGKVYASGNNSDGQLGHPETTGLLEAFIEVPGLSDVVDIEASSISSFVRKMDGSVVAFGWNGGGRLGIGDGAVTRQFGAVAVQATGLTQIRAGGGHTLAIDGNKKAFGWGTNTSGEVGNGSTGDVDTPVELPVLDDVISVDAASGGGSSGAVTQDGTVYTWGLNLQEQLGGGPGPNAVNPMVLTTVSGGQQIAVGGTHMLLLKTDGKVWAWGANGQGQLGLGTMSNAETPTEIPGLSDITAVDAGGSFSIALKSDGTVWTWGRSSEGQLGVDLPPGPQLSPVQVTGLPTITKIVAGSSHALALASDGSVWAWGLTDIGQLGIGISDWQFTPIKVF